MTGEKGRVGKKETGKGMIKEREREKPRERNYKHEEDYINTDVSLFTHHKLKIS